MIAIPGTLGIDYTPSVLQPQQIGPWGEFASGNNVLVLCGRKWGKTVFMVICCVYAAIYLSMRPERSKILFASYSYINLQGAYEAIVEWFKLLRVNHHATNAPSMQIRVGNCTIMFGSMQKGDTRLSEIYRVIFLDEAALYNDLVAWRILPTQFRHQLIKPQIIMGTTPRGPNWLKTRWDMAIDSRFQRSSYDCPFNWWPDVKAIEDQLPRRVAAAEIYARFMEGEGRVFDVDQMLWWSGQEQDLDSDEYVIAIGGDLGSREDWTVLFPITNKFRFLVPKRLQRRSWPAIIEAIKAYVNRWPEATFVIDQTGLGTVAVDYLRPHVPRMWPISFTNENKNLMISAIEVGIEKRIPRFPLDPIVRAEYAAFDYQKLPSGLYKYGAPPGQHDDTVTGSLLAYWCASRYSTQLVGNLPRG